MTVDELLEQAIAGVSGEPLQNCLRSQAAAITTDQEKMRLLATVQHIKSGQSGLNWKHMTIAIVGLLLFFWLLWALTGGAFFTDIGPGRPVLMLIVVFATVVYGGMLMNASLFGSEQAGFEQRFRRAREIFLVFSGICGTVVGFYFGAGESQEAEDQRVEVSASLGEAGVITATISGGQGPFAVSLKKDSASAPLDADPSDGNRFTLTPSAELCPSGGTYQVSGAGGAAYEGVAVGFSQAELAEAGWTACATADAADGDMENAGEPEAGAGI